MNYSALIENRKSVREFKNREVPASDVTALRSYYEKGCQRLIPEIPTELVVLGTDARSALEGSAGYQDLLVGAPQYLVLLSGDHPKAVMNAAYMMEDLVLKLEDLELNSCWITFADGEKVKSALGLNSPLKVAAIVAFGYGVRTAKKMRFNILSMSNVDIAAQRAYYAPKKEIRELVSLNELDQIQGLDEVIGFYDDMLWQSFYAASKSPSYLNRQPYAFLLKGGDLMLVELKDDYTDPVSMQQDLGVVMLHFDAVAQQWVGRIHWDLEPQADVKLPQGCKVVALYRMK